MDSFCNNVYFIIETIGHEYETDEWHLLIDSSKVSLKVVLLQNGNYFPSVPLDHAGNMKESYDNIKLILEKKVGITTSSGIFCGGLKLVALYSACNSVTQSILIFFVNGIVDI